MKYFFLLFASIYSLNGNATGLTGDSCITSELKKPTSAYISVINEAKLCRFDTSIQDDSYLYIYCDSTAYNVYSLYTDKSSELLLIEVIKNVGKVGYDYYLLEKNNKQEIEKLNVFTGYLDCIKFSSGKYPDIIFYNVTNTTNRGRIKVQITRKGKYYHRKKVLDVEGDDVTKKNKNILLRKYNSSSESKDIQKWEGF